MIQLQFFGAAGTVTGSKTLLSTLRTKILVDCGLFQGVKSLRIRNRDPFSFRPNEIERVLLTHAHLDHSGALPLLVKGGYRGKIFCTRPTQELLRILLLDFARLEKEDADLANRMGFSKHHPALPLYTQADVVQTLRRVHVLSESDWHEFGPGVKVRLLENGHILGSVFAEFEVEKKRVVFSGDLGRKRPLLLRPPKFPTKADFLVLESTYGDRLHEDVNPEVELGSLVRKAVERRGKVLIPSFAVGRSQDLLYLLLKLRRSGSLPDVPVYLDSPMAIEVSEVLCLHHAWQKLPAGEVKAMFTGIKLVKTARESMALRVKQKPAIVIAGSGMATGGRILGHLEDCLPDPRHMVLLVGYQAPGTRGRLLMDRSPTVKIRGQHIPVRAEVAQIGSLSAHADQSELVEWVSRIRLKPEVFLSHGEPQASDSLRLLLKDKLGLKVRVAQEGEIYLGAPSPL